ncbi:MAG: anthranilate synthase component 2 [Saprospiraceae bacterium]|jgi:anthranilate synthase component 2
MKILVIDNYDSFTYNLVQYLKELSEDPIDVFRNDAITLDQVAAYDFIVLSPGPGLPADAGIMPELIKQYASTKIIFGVCLGLQAIGEAFGGELHNLTQVFHGIETSIEIIDRENHLFKEVPQGIKVGRYHSWVVKKDKLPEELKITAVDKEGMIMALQHKTYEVSGVQFHPESIMTEYGKEMLGNILENAKLKVEKESDSRVIIRPAGQGI